MKSKVSKIASVSMLALLVTPLFAHAQFSGAWFTAIINFVESTLTALFPIVTAILILTFGWLVFKFLTDKDVETKEMHKSSLIKALVALFLWFTLFGLISTIADSIGVGVGGGPTTDEIPSVPL